MSTNANTRAALVAGMRQGARYELLGASVPGYGTSRWFPIEGFRIPGWVNVFPGQFELFGQCQGF